MYDAYGQMLPGDGKYQFVFREVSFGCVKYGTIALEQQGKLLTFYLVIRCECLYKNLLFEFVVYRQGITRGQYLGNSCSTLLLSEKATLAV